jgi:hypothetical protein
MDSHETSYHLSGGVRVPRHALYDGRSLEPCMLYDCILLPLGDGDHGAVAVCPADPARHERRTIIKHLRAAAARRGLALAIARAKPGSTFVRFRVLLKEASIATPAEHPDPFQPAKRPE